MDEVRYTDEIPRVLEELRAKPTLLTLNGTNSDSKKATRPAAFDGMSAFTTNSEILHPIITECRVIKSEMELEGLRYACMISSEAHKAVMRDIKPGMKV